VTPAWLSTGFLNVPAGNGPVVKIPPTTSVVPTSSVRTSSHDPPVSPPEATSGSVNSTIRIAAAAQVVFAPPPSVKLYGAFESGRSFGWAGIVHVPDAVCDPLTLNVPPPVNRMFGYD
jgi:hypothetical protein